MRPLALLLAVALLGLGACAGTEDGPTTDDGGAASESASPTPDPTPFEDTPDDPAPTPEETPEDETIRSSPTCTKVRAGIDAFNDGDFEATVARFADAEPLAAIALSEAAGTPREELWDLLLEGIQYYAVLAPDEYLEAAATSPDFARWKTVTLGLCVAGGTRDPGSPETPSQQV